MSRKLSSTGNRTLKTLERVFSKAGVGSRTEARSWISTGRVRVNGDVILNPDHWVVLGKDRITFDGKPLKKAKQVYMLLYKPKGYVVSHGDPDGRPTVYDLVRDAGVPFALAGGLAAVFTGFAWSRLRNAR